MVDSSEQKYVKCKMDYPPLDSSEHKYVKCKMDYPPLYTKAESQVCFTL